MNREYAEVLVEQNINGRTDTSYVYGVERLSLDRFDGSIGYYLYDPRGSVTGITNEEGQVYQSYRYSVTGEITFGAPRYENEYTYNAESYNPNIESQYLRARYYCVVTADFLTEDSYLGNIAEPLTLNRYNYCVSSYLNYVDPSGNEILVVSGGIDDEANFKYQFIETALLDINQMLDRGANPDDITWVIFEAGYDKSDNIQNNDLIKFENTAKKIGIGIVTISDKTQFVQYINTKSIQGCETNVRKEDQITQVSIFAHGLSQRYAKVDENQLGFAYGISDIDSDTINFKQSDIELLEKEAFDNATSRFYSCNAGTNDKNGMSFAQEWSNVTGGPSIGIRNGRTEYSFINTSGYPFTVTKHPTIDIMDYINKGKDVLYNVTGFSIFKPSIRWDIKMDKKEERKDIGYAESGSVKYPEITLPIGDLDVFFRGDFLERGVVKFEPQE